MWNGLRCWIAAGMVRTVYILVVPFTNQQCQCYFSAAPAISHRTFITTHDATTRSHNFEAAGAGRVTAIEMNRNGNGCFLLLL